MAEGYRLSTVIVSRKKDGTAAVYSFLCDRGESVKSSLSEMVFGSVFLCPAAAATTVPLVVFL